MSADPKDPFTVHEALHAAYMLQDMSEKYLAEHPAVTARPDIKALADKATDALGEVYQALGGIPEWSGNDAQR